MEAVYAGVLSRMEAAGWQPPRRRVRISKVGLLWTMLRVSLAR
jgi:phytoene synthase